MYKKIYNPLTKRSVNIDGKLGRIILKNYVDQLGGETKKDILKNSNIYAPNIYFSGLPCLSTSPSFLTCDRLDL